VGVGELAGGVGEEDWGTEVLGTGDEVTGDAGVVEGNVVGLPPDEVQPANRQATSRQALTEHSAAPRYGHPVAMAEI
jgi:hypothetical protein